MIAALPAGRDCDRDRRGAGFRHGPSCEHGGRARGARPADSRRGVSATCSISGPAAACSPSRWRRRCGGRSLASDIDPVAVRVARKTRRGTVCAAWSRRSRRAGVSRTRPFAARAPYDLVVANILAEPLRRLAPKLAPLVARGGTLVLSGILPHAARARGRRLWRARHAARDGSQIFEGWAVLVLRTALARNARRPGANRKSLVLMTAAMFQTFTETADPTKGAERAALLRAKLKELGLDGFIVPRADEHQGEYVPKSAERLAWLTGFTGSAGTAVVLADKAAIFVDGRYTLQVREQVDHASSTPVAVMETSVADWLKANASSGPEDRLRPVADDARAGHGRSPRAWSRPAPSSCRSSRTRSTRSGATGRRRRSPRCREQPEALAGKPVARKDRRGRAAASPKSAPTSAVLTDPASIAWLFNIRGGDLPHTPFPLSFALVSRRRPAGAFHRRPKALQRGARRLGMHRRRARGARFFDAADRARRSEAKSALRSAAARPRPWRG